MDKDFSPNSPPPVFSPPPVPGEFSSLMAILEKYMGERAEDGTWYTSTVFINDGADSRAVWSREQHINGYNYCDVEEDSLHVVLSYLHELSPEREFRRPSAPAIEVLRRDTGDEYAGRLISLIRYLCTKCGAIRISNPPPYAKAYPEKIVIASGLELLFENYEYSGKILHLRYCDTRI